MKELIKLIVITFAFVTVFSMSFAYADDGNNEPLPGDGTVDDPYVINSADDFLKIGDDLSAAYVLGEDMDLAGKKIEPLGDEDSPFTGNLDGAGHTITNYNYVTSDTNLNDVYCGLFSYTSGARIHDIAFKEVNVHVSTLGKTKRANVGIISLHDKGSEFENIQIEGTIYVSSYLSSIGGVTTISEGSTYSNINNDLDIELKTDNAKRKYIGGVTAEAKYFHNNGEGKTPYFYGCETKGSIKGKYTDVYAGGIGGIIDQGDIYNCTNHMDIEGFYAGGLSAEHINSLNGISDCNNDGDITGASGGGRAGGICASNSAIRNCENSGNISAGAAGGIASRGNGDILNCINRGKVESPYACGIGYGWVVSDCTNYGEITGGNVCGIGGGDRIENCINYGPITGSDCSGIESRYDSSGSPIGNTEIRDCKNYGNIAYKPANMTNEGTVRGIAYKTKKAIQCFNYGDVTGKNACGVVEINNGEITDCFNAGNIRADNNAGGIVLRNKDIVNSTYNDGGVSGKSAAGITVYNDTFGAIVQCYSIGAISGSSLTAGIAATNANNTVGSYYYEGTDKGVAKNEKGATDTTESLSVEQLKEQDSYSSFLFEEEDDDTSFLKRIFIPSYVYAEDTANDTSGKWIMSKQSGLPRLACMSDSDEIYIKSAKLKSYPAKNIANKAINKSSVKMILTYSNGKKKTVKSGFKFSKYKKSVGKRTITINYLGTTMKFKCTFVPAKVGKVKLQAKKKKVIVKIPKTAGAKKYEIYRSTKKAKGYKKITTTSKRKYIDKRVKSKKRYYYKVRAKNGSYFGAYSKVYKIKVK